jgi:hypothetical protein
LAGSGSGGDIARRETMKAARLEIGVARLIDELGGTIGHCERTVGNSGCAREEIQLGKLINASKRTQMRSLVTNGHEALFNSNGLQAVPGSRGGDLVNANTPSINLLQLR